MHDLRESLNLVVVPPSQKRFRTGQQSQTGRITVSIVLNRTKSNSIYITWGRNLYASRLRYSPLGIRARGLRLHNRAPHSRQSKSAGTITVGKRAVFSLGYSGEMKAEKFGKIISRQIQSHTTHGPTNNCRPPIDQRKKPAIRRSSKLRDRSSAMDLSFKTSALTIRHTCDRSC